MSQSRAERRRSSRGSNAPPPKRDPMTPIYLGLVAVVVLVFAGFGISNWFTNRQRAQEIAFATNTPTPGPVPTTKPVQLKNGEPVGAPYFPKADIKKGLVPDYPSGGRGDAVDGIPCETQEGVVMHIHSILTIVDRGKPIQVPAFIGFAPNAQGGCLYWLHTHDASGIIHVESGSITEPQTGGPFTLGNFFDIWGQQLTPTQVGPFSGAVTAYINGQPYSGDLRAIPLRSHQRITLEIGKPAVSPPTYILPEGD
jgi:hypothetical protein